MADESNYFFWEMIEFLVEEESNIDKMTEKELYDKVVSFSSRYAVKYVRVDRKFRGKFKPQFCMIRITE